MPYSPLSEKRTSSCGRGHQQVARLNTPSSGSTWLRSTGTVVWNGTRCSVSRFPRSTTGRKDQRNEHQWQERQRCSEPWSCERGFTEWRPRGHGVPDAKDDGEAGDRYGDGDSAAEGNPSFHDGIHTRALLCLVMCRYRHKLCVAKCMPCSAHVGPRVAQGRAMCIIRPPVTLVRIC